MTRTISTTISDEAFAFVKANHLHWNELIIRGLTAWKGQENLVNRMRELEEGNVRLQAKLTFLSEQYVKSQSHL